MDFFTVHSFAVCFLHGIAAISLLLVIVEIFLMK